MKAQTIAKLSLFAILAMGSFTSSAEGAKHRPVTRIDFNKMIDANNNERAELKKGIDQQAAEPQELGAIDETSEQEHSDVVDFVDVELGWGVTPPVVDRRFNSIGEARPYKMNEQDLENPDQGS